MIALLLALLAAPAQAAAQAPPRIDASWVTDVTATSLSLHAEIDPAGSATAYHFSYITESAYLANLSAGREGFAGATKAPPGADPGLGSATTDQPAIQQLSGLQSETAYRFRAIAHSEGGSVIGPERVFATQGFGGGPLLADDRGWEMVSPVEKNGGQVQGFGQNFGGDVLQAASDGESITYSSNASFGGSPPGAAPASQYIARRGSDGWSTENISTPALSGSYGEHPDGVPYQLFSPDLSEGLLLNGRHCRSAGLACAVPNPPLPGTEAPVGYQNYYLRDDANGSFRALLTSADIEALVLGPEEFDLALAGASPDLRHIVLSTCAALTSEAFEEPEGEGCDPNHPNLYEWSEGALSEVNFTAGEILPTPPGVLAAQSGAISADGSRVYWNDPQTGALFLHEEGKREHPVEGSSGEEATFQTASSDGSLAFFTEGPSGDQTLYRYDAASGSSEQIATEVEGVLGASEDGSHLYYATASGLFLWDAGTVTEVAPGAEAAAPGDYPPTIGTARVSPNGSRLAFLSRSSLSDYEDTDVRTGQPDTEVYLYVAPAGADGVGTLICASCNPSGERPLGPSSLPGAIANGTGVGAIDSYKPRDLSADGNRLFFDSADALVFGDTNNAPDVYEWEAGGEGTCQKPTGCVSLISSGTAPEGASFIDASEDGSDAFFLTASSLVPSDPGSVDLYDAREGGGFPVSSSPIECDGDACQSLPPEPEDPSPGTLSLGGGNPPLHFPKPTKCKSGFVRRHGKCVKKPRRHRKSRKRAAHRRRGDTR